MIQSLPLRWLRSKNTQPGLVLEWSIAAITVASVIYTVIHLWVYSYLPQPFFYEPNDIYADWFNTAYWARDPGSYDVWATLYPPLSFVFLRIFGLERCYLTGRAYDPSAGYPGRDCDWLGIASIWGFYILDVILVYLTFRKIDKKTAIPRTICLGLGWPMLDGVERGNLVLVSFTCVILAFGPLLRSARLRWLFAGLAINFKVYLISSVVPLLLKRKWRWVECALIATVIVYIISFAILGRGTPREIYENLAHWDQLEPYSPLDMWFATTYNQLLALMEGNRFPVAGAVGSELVDLAVFYIPLLVHFTQLLILAAAAATWLRPEAVSTTRVVTLGVMLALITKDSGGYSPVYFTYLVLMEPWRGAGRKWAILACYLLAPSIDIPIGEMPPLVRDTYFRGTTTIATFYVTAGPLLRPFLILTIAMAIALSTIADVWRDVRHQGWADRWRFRRDLQLLPGVQRPERPDKTSTDTT